MHWGKILLMSLRQWHKYPKIKSKRSNYRKEIKQLGIVRSQYEDFPIHKGCVHLSQLFLNDENFRLVCSLSSLFQVIFVLGIFVHGVFCCWCLFYFFFCLPLSNFVLLFPPFHLSPPPLSFLVFSSCPPISQSTNRSRQTDERMRSIASWLSPSYTPSPSRSLDQGPQS